MMQFFTVVLLISLVSKAGNGCLFNEGITSSDIWLQQMRQNKKQI